jgi:hypothetical protein
MLGCQDIKELGGGAGLDLPWLDVVYQCQTESETLELCWDSGAWSLSVSLTENGYGATTCRPTPRHSGPCIYCCSDCGRGANAFNGSWCPS